MAKRTGRPAQNSATAPRHSAVRQHANSPGQGRRGTKKARLGLTIGLCLLVGLAVLLAWPLSLWLGGAGAASSLGSLAAQGPGVSPSASLAPSSAAAPTSFEEPAPQPPALAFTEEEIARLDAMLAEWAAAPTLITKTEDEEGNPLPEPVEVADGGHAVAVWFLDLESGAAYSYNAQASFYYASIMKAPYATYLYRLAGQGALDLQVTLEVTPAHVAGYERMTGVLKTMPLPAAFTVQQLLEYLIRESDTVALKVLLEQWPATEFVAWAQSLGLADAAALRSVVYGRVSANDAGILLRAMAEEMDAGTYGALLKENLMSTRMPLITSGYPVAHKYGWDKGALNDMAVVYAPHPYLLVILTDKYGGSRAEQAMFGTVANALEEMMAAKWAGV